MLRPCRFVFCKPCAAADAPGAADHRLQLLSLAVGFLNLLQGRFKLSVCLACMAGGILPADLGLLHYLIFKLQHSTVQEMRWNHEYHADTALLW